MITLKLTVLILASNSSGKISLIAGYINTIMGRYTNIKGNVNK
jgi:hypothetical protein